MSHSHPSAEFHRIVAEHVSDAVMITDADERHVWVSESVTELLGYRPEEMIGRTPWDFVDADTAADIIEGRRKAGDRLAGFDELPVRRADGTVQWVSSRSVPCVLPDGSPGRVVALRDATARHDADVLLRVRALRDELTGLANRPALLDELSRSLSSARRSGTAAAVLMIDLDHFKYVNDSLGHGVGDQLLVAAAARLVGAVRGHDLVARLGGDEFVVVMRDVVEPADAMAQALRVVEQFRQPLTISGTDLYTTASIGLALSSTHTEPGDLLRDADTALYVAKGLGRDRVAAFTDALRDEVMNRLELGVQLRPALEHSEFEVWYQPEIDLVSGEVSAVEALLRWRRADGEVVDAADFIDVADESGLLPDIGDWVLAQACRHTARWNARMHGPPLTVRVNLSANQLAEGRLLMTVDDALTASGLEPHFLCIELDEWALQRENATARDNLAALHARGVRLSIDDFGAGYASLSYLRDLPVDVIKVDRSFISRVADDERDHRIVAGIVALAHRLGVAVTAEGVEDASQEQVLRGMRCTAAQGYHFARPMPADDVDWFVQQQRAGLVQR